VRPSTISRSYGPSASTIGANRAGRAAVHEIQQVLRSLDPSALRPAKTL
jgi:hypothetical protein